jgi:DNA-directed RNA polymerase specialized sigma24 family protein
MDQAEVLQPEYAAWLERVRATYEAVAYTCGYRLHDRELGRRVGAAVVAGLVRRPGVFRYQGLPFSGRIAVLAEALLAEAREGRLPVGPEWSRVWVALTRVPPDVQEVFVLSCVHGRDVAEVAVDLGCDRDGANSRCVEAFRVMREIGESAGSGLVDSKG